MYNKNKRKKGVERIKYDHREECLNYLYKKAFDNLMELVDINLSG
jgi:hypothetical protein